MQVVYGYIWKYPTDYICITTNGDINRLGAAVMGKGIAKQAKERIPKIEYSLAACIQKHGHRTHMLTRFYFNRRIISFPVKYHWKEDASRSLIIESAYGLAALANKRRSKIFVLPRPGCKNGGLVWKEVKSLIEDILPDNVHVITNNPTGAL